MSHSAAIPGQRTSSSDRFALLVEELTAKLQAGELIDVESFLQAHPEDAEQLRRLLPALLLLAEVSRSGSGSAPGAAAGVELGELGDFRLIREVGRGGMGIVYEAEQLSLGRRVALKVLPFAATMDARHLQRFQNEARAAAGLHHTNIVPVHAVGQERGVHYYAMQFIDGCTLAQVIATARFGPSGSDSMALTGPYTPSPAGAEPAVDTVEPAAAGWRTQRSHTPPEHFRTAARLGVQAAEALEHAHQLGIVHRDVKPANLLVDAAGTLWVTDFGLAQVQSDAKLTLTGDLVGTLRYMSPEQALAKRVVIDHRTDVYSLGATLYELLTLEPVFAGSDRQELLRQIAFEEPRPPRKVNRSVPKELETVVLKALAKNPAERYQSAQELADDLRRFLNSEPIRARRPSLAQRARKWARRHRGVVATATAGLLACLALLGGVAGWVMHDRADESKRLSVEFDKAMREAEALQEQGNWPAMRRVIDSARALLASRAVSPDQRRRAEELQADLDMASRLEGVSLIPTPIGGKQTANSQKDPRDTGILRAVGRVDLTEPDPRVDAWLQQDPEYAQAFQDFGVDVAAVVARPGGADPNEVKSAGERLGARTIRVQLAAALDHWALMRSSPKRNLPGWQALLDISQIADPDPQRNEFRQALQRKDWKSLTELASSEHVLSWPARTVTLLSVVLRETGAAEESLALLRRVHERHPDYYTVNTELTAALLDRDVPLWAEALHYATAAVALRPYSAGAHVHLGVALADKGDLDRAVAAWREAVQLQPDLAGVHHNLGLALAEMGKLDQAVAAYREAIRHRPKLMRARIDLARALEQQEKYDEAIDVYYEAKAIQEDLALAYDRLGIAYYFKGDLKKAIEVQIQGLPYWPESGRSSAQAYQNVATSYRDVKDWDNAIAAYEMAIKRDPKFSSPYNDLAVALHEKGDLEGAKARLKQARDLAPDNWVAYSNLGHLFRDKDPDTALEAYKKLVFLRPNDAAAFADLGTLLAHRGDHKGAADAYRKAIAIEGNRAAAHVNLSNCLSRLKDYKGAETEARTALTIDKDSAEAHSALANALMDLGPQFWDEALTECLKSVILKADRHEAQNLLGTIYAERKMYDKAVDAYLKAIDINHKFAPAHYNLGNAYDDQGMFPEAVAAYREALKHMPEHYKAHSRLGGALMKKGFLDDAIKELREAVLYGPDSPIPLGQLSNALEKKGLLKEALAKARKAVGLAPDDPEGHYRVGTQCMHANLLDEAIGPLKEAIRLDPNYPEAYCNLGHALQRQGKFREALPYFQRGHELRYVRSVWNYQSAQWVAECQRLVNLDGRFSRLLSTARPADAREQVELAYFCAEHKELFGLAARWLGEALAAEPGLADVPKYNHRFVAACLAAMAGTGKGRDAPSLTDKDRARLREQSRAWLQADLLAWAKHLDGGTDQAARNVQRALVQWQRAKAFDDVRGDRLENLPAEEREAWRKIWTDSEALDKKARTTKP
jgi:tetratricopeptide (TPR) repeat protein